MSRIQGPSKARFQQIFEEGRRVSTRFVRIVSLPGRGFIGFATAKTIGNKPRRNQARRRAAEVLRSMPGCIPVGLDLVIQVNVAGASAEFVELQNDLRQALGQTTERWANESASS